MNELEPDANLMLLRAVFFVSVASTIDVSIYGQHFQSENHQSSFLR